MWTDSTNSFCLIWRALCLLLAIATAPFSYGQEGQYRSKIRIDPDGGIGQGAGLSIAELEQQINSIADSYARSSAGRHLARHFVEQGEYDKAIDYYRTALSADGLSDIANREMLRELARVYLLSEDYSAAASTLERALRIQLVADPADYLLLAQAYYRLGKLVQVVAALDPIAEQGLVLTVPQQRQALALYYQAGAYAQCEQLLRKLLNVEPNNPENWHQLASVYLQQGKRKQALDQLALAWEKAVPFREQDTRLLAELQAVNGNPYGAAVILEGALEDQRIPANGLNYRKLFQFWLQARENDRAMVALVQAARLSGDIELYLYLAQLQMEQEAWQPMYQTMLAACSKQLPDKYVGRANLFLGISQLKLGDEASARRAFINATLIGGAGPQAGRWLDFMKAEPPTRQETRRIVGICHGARGRRVSADEFVADNDTDTVADALVAATGNEQPAVVVETKTVPEMSFFYLNYSKPFEQLATDAKSLALAMGVALVKSGGTVDGPLQIIAQGSVETDELQLGFPYRGAPGGRGRYKTRGVPAFRCAYLIHEGEMDSLAELWAEFLTSVEAAGYEVTQERRVLLSVKGGGGGNDARVELQIGIK